MIFSSFQYNYKQGQYESIQSHSMIYITMSVLATSLLFYAINMKSYKRPLPKWYDEAKIGIFIHWGVFSVPSYRTEWFWWMWQGDKTTMPEIPEYMRKYYEPDFAYANFAKQFHAEFFEPDKWPIYFRNQEHVM
ncbi:unnamed protein product [Schistosoma mattheei]|uniref:alpha-L-fucosidase n=1 Tax=Schistosoma mattheei TaxID=31246 RepID=A0AA85B003_9TREM|nr:unnamed protein product [Schistosoma mattheei]